MEFREVYCSEAKKLEAENKNKIVLSNDAFAIAEALSQVAVQLFRGSRHG